MQQCCKKKITRELVNQNNNNMKQKLFQYAVIWHPTESQIKEEKKESKLIVSPSFLLAMDEKAAALSAAMEIPQDYKKELSQIEVVVRPF